jgi:hypothetical protein
MAVKNEIMLQEDATTLYAAVDVLRRRNEQPYHWSLRLVIGILGKFADNLVRMSKDLS